MRSRSRASRFDSGSSNRIACGLPDHRPAERDPLLLAARELVHEAAAHARRARPTRASPRSSFCDPGLRQRAAGFQRVGDVAGDRQVRPERVALEHHAEPARFRRLVPSRRGIEGHDSPITIRPASGPISPAIERSTVVLPQPLGPRVRCTARPGNSRLKSSSAPRAAAVGLRQALPAKPALAVAFKPHCAAARRHYAPSSPGAEARELPQQQPPETGRAPGAAAKSTASSG